jgi:fibronectin-binding autotransporter adhesin
LEDRVTPSTILVTSSFDPPRVLVRGSLRWAIAQANLPKNRGSTVEITSAAVNNIRTIILHAGELPIRSSMTIENASGLPLTIQQSTPNSRLFHVFANRRTTAVTITGLNAYSPLTLTGGKVVGGNGGGILVDNPANALTLSDVNVIGNAAIQIGSPRRASHGNGGGVYSRGTVSLDDSNVSSNSAIGPNSASGQAGGIYTDRGLTLVASHVDSNTARNFGGILNVIGPVQVLAASTVNGNASSGNSLATGNTGGGGIAEMNGNVTVSDSQVSNNKTVGMYSGGIVLLLGGATVTDGSQVDGNTNNGPGGGIAANFGGAVTIRDGSQVDGNTGAGLGGGVVTFAAAYGVNVVDGSQVDNNTLTNIENAAVTSGLVLLVRDPKLGRTFRASGRGDPVLRAALRQFTTACLQLESQLLTAITELPSNGDVEVGGGIGSILTGPIVISGGSAVNGNLSGALVANNPFPGYGGGVFANLGPVTIDGSTVSGNSATGEGGGIWNGQSLILSNSNVVQNQAGTQGGGVFNRGTFTSNGSIITGNTPEEIYPSS